MLFCIGDYENAISLYRGKTCIGGQILAYFGNFLYTINPGTMSRFTLFGRDRLDRARAWQTSQPRQGSLNIICLSVI